MRGPGFSVRNRTLLAIAGSVWLAAGGNVARIGVQAYRGCPGWGRSTCRCPWWCLACLASMFFRMSQKHTRRIRGYAGETQPFWRFFDRKAYLIMAVMMGAASACGTPGWCRRSLWRCSTPAWAALALAGVCFWGPSCGGLLPWKRAGPMTGKPARLPLAGCLWPLAGGVVTGLGLAAYGTLPRVGWLRPVLSLVVFQVADAPSSSWPGRRPAASAGTPRTGGPCTRPSPCAPGSPWRGHRRRPLAGGHRLDPPRRGGRGVDRPGGRPAGGGRAVFCGALERKATGR